MPRFVFPVAIVVAAAVPALAAAQEKPLMIITDTPDYCEDLHRRLAACPSADPVALSLIREGQQMCDHGEVRGGILRLRRALLLMRRSHAC